VDRPWAANLISLLNPEAIVIGGELGLALRPYYNEIRREARRWSEPTSGRNCRIIPSTLGRSAVLIGAARLAWQEAAL
jgi:predicted NBD/HSP70 family sugar kinase